MSASIELDANDLKALIDYLRVTPKELAIAQVRALNRAADGARTEIARTIGLNLPAKTIKADLRVRHARLATLTASIDGQYKQHLLSSFGSFTETRGRVRNTARGTQTILARAGAQGLSVRLYKRKPPVRYPHGFMLRRGSRTRGVAAHRAPRGAAGGINDYFGGDIRPGETYAKRLTGRKPLLLLAGPTMADEIAEGRRRFEAMALKRYRRRLTHEIDYVLSKR